MRADKQVLTLKRLDGDVRGEGRGEGGQVILVRGEKFDEGGAVGLGEVAECEGGGGGGEEEGGVQASVLKSYCRVFVCVVRIFGGVVALCE